MFNANVLRIVIWQHKKNKAKKQKKTTVAVSHFSVVIMDIHAKDISFLQKNMQFFIYTFLEAKK